MEVHLEHGVFNLVDITQEHGAHMVVKGLGFAELPVFTDWLSYCLTLEKIDLMPPSLSFSIFEI